MSKKLTKNHDKYVTPEDKKKIKELIASVNMNYIMYEDKRTEKQKEHAYNLEHDYSTYTK